MEQRMTPEEALAEIARVSKALDDRGVKFEPMTVEGGEVVDIRFGDPVRDFLEGLDAKWRALEDACGSDAERNLVQEARLDIARVVETARLARHEAKLHVSTIEEFHRAFTKKNELHLATENQLSSAVLAAKQAVEMLRACASMFGHTDTSEIDPEEAMNVVLDAGRRILILAEAVDASAAFANRTGSPAIWDWEKVFDRRRLAQAFDQQEIEQILSVFYNYVVVCELLRELLGADRLEHTMVSKAETVSRVAAAEHEVSRREKAAARELEANLKG